MALPRRNEQNEHREPATTRPDGPVLFETDPTPATATAAALVPPPRLPPGIAATDTLPEPDPDRSAGWPLSGNYPMPEYIQFDAALFVVILVMLVLFVAAGLLAVAASYR